MSLAVFMHGCAPFVYNDVDLFSAIYICLLYNFSFKVVAST